MYFKFNLLVYWFTKIFVEKTNSQTDKDQWRHIFKNGVVYLYYKERRQLKTFLTQIGSALPLTPDPSVTLHDD
jgi:hypothetical protein